MNANYFNKLNGSRENCTSLTRLVRRVDSSQHFIIYYLRTLETKMKIGANNVLNVDFTFYGRFELERKHNLISTPFACMFYYSNMTIFNTHNISNVIERMGKVENIIVQSLTFKT
jgi:hypothetical protein